MQFNDRLSIDAPLQRVWEFLIDPESVGACGPGIESVEVQDDTHFRAIVKVGIGQFRARFTVGVEMVGLEPPSAAGMRAQAQAPGTAVDAVAHMQLEDIGGTQTIMAWNADVSISGKLAAVGARLIEWQANRLIGQTFDCIKSRLEDSA